MNGPLGDNLLHFLQHLLSVDAASQKKTKSPVFETKTSVNGSLAAQFLQIQHTQPIHFTHKDTPPLPLGEILAPTLVFFQDVKLNIR